MGRYSLLAVSPLEELELEIPELLEAPENP
jgi:hypothetical protein